MLKYRLIMVFVAGLCVGCSSAIPTAPEAVHATIQLSSDASAHTALASPTPVSSLVPLPSIDVTIYQAVLDKHFVPRNPVEELARSDIFSPTVVYIDPVFVGKQAVPVPEETLSRILHYTDALRLTRVLAEQPGGVVMRLSEPHLAIIDKNLAKPDQQFLFRVALVATIVFPSIAPGMQ